MGHNTVPPTNPEMLERLVTSFVGEQKKSVVALDGVEYLATYAGFPRVLKTLQSLRDLVTGAQGVFIVSVDSAALEERDWLVLEREFESLPHAVEEGAATQDVFVIHSSGLLVTHSEREQRARAEGADRDLMAGMLTAIMNFAKVSFAEGTQELRRLDLGEKKVVIERGDKLILAVVFKGREPEHIEDEMRAFLCRAERKFGDRLDRWSGSVEELSGLGAMTARLLL